MPGNLHFDKIKRNFIDLSKLPGTRSSILTQGALFSLFEHEFLMVGSNKKFKMCHFHFDRKRFA